VSNDFVSIDVFLDLIVMFLIIFEGSMLFMTDVFALVSLLFISATSSIKTDKEIHT